MGTTGSGGVLTANAVVVCLKEEYPVKFALIAALVLLSACNKSEMKKDIKQAGAAAHRAVDSATSAAEKVTDKTAEATKVITRDAGKLTKEAAATVEKKSKEAVHSAAEVTESAARKVKQQAK